LLDRAAADDALRDADRCFPSRSAFDTILAAMDSVTPKQVLEPAIPNRLAAANSETPGGPLASTASRRRGRFARWVRGMVSFAFALWIASIGLSLLVRHSGLNRYLTAKLATAFGRPVEVGHYDFSLLAGPRLEANSVTVGEDPRFGHEYFLRAEQLTVSLRWQALLRGHVEFGTLSFTRPCLNLVLAPDGRWNLEDWLPHPADSKVTGTAVTTVAAHPAAAGAVPHPARIEVDGGRIDFKRGADKLPFALMDVKGEVEQDGPGRWRLDLEARPMRAAVIVQEAGTVRLRGLVGGTSSRLRPAELELNWQDASLSDVLRLARDRDYGIRGRFSVIVQARSDGPDWTLIASTQLRRLHRWDFPLRAGDPAVNAHLSAQLWPSDSRIELQQLVLETPRSNARASGSFSWARLADAPRGLPNDFHLQVRSSTLYLDDVLAWYRAFHSGVANELSLRGMADVDLNLDGWPPRIEQAVVASDGAQLEGGSLRAPVRVSRMALRIEQGRATLAPTTVALANEPSAVHLEATGRRDFDWSWSAKAAGQTERLQDLFAAAAAAGWSLPRGWAVEGPLKFDLHWQDARNPFRERPAGTIELGGLTLRAPFLNRAMSQIKAHVELRPTESRVALASAQAFGAHWSGALRRTAGSAAWEGSLAADRLSAAEFDRWLDPRWREGLLERILPILRPAPQPFSLPQGLSLRGQLTVDQLDVEPAVLHRLRAGFDLNLDARSIELRDAQADFFGGTVHGTLHAQLSPEPSYRVEARLDHVDLVQLAAATSTLRQRFAGIASGEVLLSAHGIGRDALVNSLEGRGSIDARDAQIAGVDLEHSLRSPSREPGTSAFRLAAGSFTVGAGMVRFTNLRLFGLSETWQASGSVDFSRKLDFRVRPMQPALAEKHLATFGGAPGDAKGTFRFLGSLDAPQMVRLGTESQPR
jgi:hypothetical protein